MSDLTDRELLELIAAQVGKLTNELADFKRITTGNFSHIENRFDGLDKRLIVIENEHGSKINAILDGYKQLTEVQEEIKSDVHAIKSKQDKDELIKQFVNNIKK